MEMGVKDDEEQRQPAASRPSKGREGTHDESEQGLDGVLVLGLGAVWVLAGEVVCDAGRGERGR